MNTPNFTLIDYSPPPAAPGDSSVVYSDMVHGFLSLVQRNPFPPEFLITLIQSKFTDYDTQAIINYEFGFIVCAALGCLFIVIMPLAGLIFCICRCFYKRCGGEMHQTISRYSNYQRIFFFFSVLLLTIIILVGNIAMFVNNTDTSNGVSLVFQYFNDTVNNVDLYLGSIYKEFSIVINASNRTVSFANESLSSIGEQLGGRIHNEIGIRVYPEMDKLLLLWTWMNATKVLFKRANDSYNKAHGFQIHLGSELKSVRQGVHSTISSPLCRDCGSTSTSDLEFNANYNVFPDFSKQYKLLSDLEHADIPSIVKKANDTVHSIPQQVTTMSKATVKATLKELVEFRNEVQKIKKELTFTKHLTNVTNSVKNFSVSVYNQRSEVERYDYIRWSVCFILSFMVFSIVFCNVLGLLLGPFGLETDDDPVKRGFLANTGGNFLMAGAGLSFAFTWLLMVAVILVFLVGGNMYTLICKPWNSGELFTLIDTPGLIEGFNLSELMGIKNRTLTVASIYSQCKENQPLWAALHLDDRVHLKKHLDFSKFEKNIIGNFKNMTISLDEIEIYTDELKRVMWNIVQTTLKEIDFTYINQQLEKTLLRIDFLSYANRLKELATANNDPVITANLTTLANRLISIDSEIKIRILPNANALRQDIQDFKVAATKAELNLIIAITGGETIYDYIEHDIPLLIDKGTDHFRNTIVNYCQSYVKWASITMRKNVAACAPVSYTFDSLFIMCCEYVVDSLNDFWFSLGWCLAFLTPCIILSIKLAKYYKRMETADVVIDEDDDDLELELNAAPKKPIVYKINLDAGSSKKTPWSRPIFIQG